MKSELLEFSLVSVLIAIFQAIVWVFAVVGIAFLGWAISSLNVLAGWTPADLATRLEIVRGILSSIAAGGVAAVAGAYYGLPLPVMMMSIFFAGMMGDKFLKPLGERFMGRIGAAFDGFFGKSGNGGPKP